MKKMNALFANKKLDPRIKYIFGSALIVGIFSQGMGLFNKFSVHDDPINYTVGATYTSGRWMLDILSRLEVKLFGAGHYSLPGFNGFLAIALIAASACLLVYILDINNPLLCVFVSGLMVCFPVVTSIFGFMFTAHYYMLALLIGTAGVFCICKTGKWWLWIAGIMLIGASTGIYQAFFPVAITVLLLYLIDFVAKNDDRKEILKRIVVCGLSSVLSLGFYFVVNHLYLLRRGAVLSSYKGIDTMGKAPVSEYLSRVIDAYKEFFLPDRSTSFYMYSGTILSVYRIVLVLSVIFSVVLAARLIKKKKLNALLFLLLLAVVPLGVNLIIVMAGKQEVHSLMVYSQLFPFVYFAWLLENLAFDRKTIEKTVAVASTILMILILIMFSREDNKCYLKATFAQQEAISYFTTLVTEIKSTDGYDDEMPVVFINERNLTDTSLQFGDNGMLSNISILPYEMDVTDYVNDYRWFRFMRQWTGYSPTIVESDEFENLDEVKDMPSYPDDGSIKIVNGTVVVKF